MKVYQPLAVVGFGFGGALFFMSLLPFRYTTIAIILAGIVFVGFLIYCLLRSFTMTRVVLCVAFFMVFLGTVINTGQRIYWANAASLFPSSPIEVIGTVEEVYQSNGQTKSCLIKTEQIALSGIPQRMRFLIYSANDSEIHQGERIACKITGFHNVPTRSQLGKGAQVTGWLESDSQTLLEAASSADQLMEDLRFRLKVHLKQTVPSPYDTVLLAMLLGDSSEMDTALYDSFNLTGISHILCVSGLHITLIGGLIAGLFQLIFGKRIFPDMMGLAAMIFFVTLTGGKPSAVRALIMAAMLMFTRHIVRDYSPVNTLGGVMLFFCILEPSIVYHMGFLMSVTSICALCAVSPCWAKEILEKNSIKNGLLQYFVSIFCSSGAVAVFLVPIMMLFNGYTSLLSPVANLLVLPMVPCVMILGAISVVMGGAATGMLAGQMSGVLLKVMVFFTETLGKVPFATFPLNLPYTGIWIVGTVVLILVAIAAGRLRKNGKQIIGISAGLLVLGMGFYFVGDNGTLQVASLKSGEEGSSIVVSQNEKALVIGCGGSSVIGSKTAHYMRSIGVHSFEMLIVPDGKERQASGVSRLVTLMEPKVIVAPEESNYLSSAYDLPDSKRISFSHLRLEVLDNVSLEIEEGEHPRIVLTGNGQQFFIETDGTFGLLQDSRELLLKKGQKEDTLEPKYDIITADVIEKLEESNFESIGMKENFVVRVAKNGKMTVRRR